MSAPLAALSGRSVFVTGHTGFKGAWLCHWLGRLGARVTGYALEPPSEPSAFLTTGVEAVLRAHHRGDVRDAPRLFAALRDAAPDLVLHLAAQALVRPSYLAPRETFDVNVMGTVGVLEAVRQLGRPCAVIVVTSDKCYENREHPWGYREVDPLGGADPYSASKGAAEIVVAAYRSSFFPPERLAEHGVALASVRAGNVIGGGDWSVDRIVADLARSLSAGRPALVRNPRSIRPWQHVLEPLGGYLLLAARMLGSPGDSRLSSAWNFGPSSLEKVTVGELADMFVAAWGSGTWVDQSQEKHPEEARTLRLCIDKAVSDLGWRPRWSVQEAVVRAARWYKSYDQWREAPDASTHMRAAMLSDIADYETSGEGHGKREAADGSIVV